MIIVGIIKLNGAKGPRNGNVDCTGTSTVKAAAKHENLRKHDVVKG